MRISIAVDEPTWRRLRDLAEIQRNGGRASVSRIMRQALEKIIEDANPSPAGSTITEYPAWPTKRSP